MTSFVKSKAVRDANIRKAFKIGPTVTRPKTRAQTKLESPASQKKPATQKANKNEKQKSSGKRPAVKKAAAKRPAVKKSAVKKSAVKAPAPSPFRPTSPWMTISCGPNGCRMKKRESPRLRKIRTFRSMIRDLVDLIEDTKDDDFVETVEGLLDVHQQLGALENDGPILWGGRGLVW